ncbi:MAG: hypothetical protein R2855_02330 [Thermomicrobiales bacterium]
MPDRNRAGTMWTSEEAAVIMRVTRLGHSGNESPAHSPIASNRPAIDERFGGSHLAT